ATFALNAASCFLLIFDIFAPSCSILGAFFHLSYCLIFRVQHIWNNGYAESRLRFIHNDIPCATEDSRAIASNLAESIQATPSKKQYGHGDVHLGNMLTEQTDTKVSVHLLDPMVKLDPAEATFRHLTINPYIAGAVIEEYERQKNVELNGKLVYAYGALTHLYNCLLAPNDPRTEQRQVALKHCLSEIGL
ncbi:MAG: hypothetical protein PHW76_09260, partial [Alphaproteobacteria bacterium]|nr:hypothetical protein [Alphaproteobacteria bacterium]